MICNLSHVVYPCTSACTSYKVYNVFYVQLYKPSYIASKPLKLCVEFRFIFRFLLVILLMWCIQYCSSSDVICH